MIFAVFWSSYSGFFVLVWFFFFFGVNKKERSVFCLVQTDHRHLIAKYSYPQGENSGQFSGAYFEKTLS